MNSVLSVISATGFVFRCAAIGGVAAIAGVIAWRRRKVPSAPTQPRGAVPAQLNREDFHSPTSPWLVVSFTSSTCSTCVDVARKAAVLASREVVVQEVEFGRDRALHDRYCIDAVPTLVIADRRGVVQFGHLGPITATDLWAAMARCRDPQMPPTEC